MLADSANVLCDTKFFLKQDTKNLAAWKKCHRGNKSKIGGLL